ncbi:MAG TPA: HupE/UreJ family protein, partial [Polyangiales bacterium]|nr:HupE/UreJ family protein [Polyangiales bacterium]
MPRRRLGFDRLIAYALCFAPGAAHAHAPGLDKPLPALAEYFRLGFEHILSGYDHLAFLLGLTLLTRSRRAVLMAVTAFTLAHSLSLALCVLGLVAPPARWVETAIALSIVAAAVNNLVRAIDARWAVAFALGLLHGFGFSSVLVDLGLPRGALAGALFGFN